MPAGEAAMRFAIVDLECTALKSDQGFLLCGGIKELGGKAKVVGLHTAGFENGRLHIDKKLALAPREATEALGVASRKTALDLNTWKEAEAEALAHFANGRKNYDYIVEHCEKDLLVTEQVYERLKNRVQQISKR